MLELLERDAELEAEGDELVVGLNVVLLELEEELEDTELEGVSMVVVVPAEVETVLDGLAVLADELCALELDNTELLEGRSVMTLELDRALVVIELDVVELKGFITIVVADCEVVDGLMVTLELLD